MKTTYLLAIIFALLINSSIVSADDLLWTKVTPTGDIPYNITGSAFVDDNFGNAYLLLGHREIWPLNGDINITFINSVYKYDSDGHEWDLINVAGTKPVPRAYPAGVWSPLQRRVYIYGGSTFNNQYGDVVLYDDFWYFNAITKTYVQITPLSLERPGPRSGAKLFIVGSKLYLFGGVSDFLVTEFGALPLYTNELWEFDLLTFQWSFIDEVGPSPRSEPQYFDRLGKLYINGGEYFSLETFEFVTPNDTWVFNTITEDWDNVTPSPSYNILPARNYAASFPFVVQWGVYGGELEGNQISGCGAPFPQNVGGDLWIYFPLLNKWQHVVPSGTAPPPLKRSMGARVGLKKSIIVSGFNFICPGPGQVYNNDVYELSYD